MSEREKLILKTMSNILSRMTEEEKMYLLGQVEGMALAKKNEHVHQQINTMIN